MWGEQGVGWYAFPRQMKAGNLLMEVKNVTPSDYAVANLVYFFMGGIHTQVGPRIELLPHETKTIEITVPPVPGDEPPVPLPNP